MFTVLACGFYIPSLKITDDRVMYRDIHLFYVTLIGYDKANYRYSPICSLRTENQLFFTMPSIFITFFTKKLIAWVTMGVIFNNCHVTYLMPVLIFFTKTPSCESIKSINMEVLANK